MAASWMPGEILSVGRNSRRLMTFTVGTCHAEKQLDGSCIGCALVTGGVGLAQEWLHVVLCALGFGIVERVVAKRDGTASILPGLDHALMHMADTYAQLVGNRNRSRFGARSLCCGVRNLSAKCSCVAERPSLGRSAA